MRDSTPGEVLALSAVTQALAEIDGRFPPPTPTVTSRVRAVAMAADGVIELHDGRRIRIDGIRCSAGGLIYLEALVRGADVELFVEPSIGADGDPLPVNVWTTDVAEQRRNFSSPAETALTSGWCTSEITATSMFNERYAALTRMASSRARGN